MRLKPKVLAAFAELIGQMVKVDEAKLEELSLSGILKSQVGVELIQIPLCKVLNFMTVGLQIDFDP